MRLFAKTLEADLRAIQAILDPRRVIRWVYLGRLIVVTAIFVASLVGSGQQPDLVPTLAFAVAMVFTIASGIYTEINDGRISETFCYLQAVLDILLVTAIVHATEGADSQFAALYILVIAIASLLLRPGGGLLIASLGIVLYSAAVIFWGGTTDVLDWRLWLQLAVFTLVALASGYLSSQLKVAGEGKEVLAAELVHLRLQAADILRNIRSGILTIDTEGRLLHANPAAASLLGVPLDGYMERPVIDVLRGAAPDLAIALERTIVHGVRTTRGEGTIEHSGRSFPIGVTTTYSQGDGIPTSATAIFQDISDQKQIESLNLRAERLEGVAELSASLAHEIKNPLASIRSAVEQLSSVPRADEDEKTLASLIVREVDRLSRLLSEFIDFAKVRVTRLERLDIGEVARGAARLASSHPEAGDGLTVTCNAPETPLLLDGDEDLLHRAVFNLTLNAVQAAPANGEVVVEVVELKAGELPHGPAFESGAVRITVRDNGPGIPEGIRERLFDPFTTTKAGGSGLGLSVVHRAVNAHQGHVLVESSAAGTCFTVNLPTTQSVNGDAQ